MRSDSYGMEVLIAQRIKGTRWIIGAFDGPGRVINIDGVLGTDVAHHTWAGDGPRAGCSLRQRYASWA